MNPLRLLIEFLTRLFAPKQEPPPAAPRGITMSPEGRKVLMYFEGLRLTAYQDITGVWTVGYGHTGPDVKPGTTITVDRAYELLEQRLAKEFVPGVLAVLTRSVRQHELDAMVDLAYNVGVGAFQKSTLVKKFNEGDRAGAADEFLRWDKAGGKSVLGLRRRRAADRALFLGASADEAIEIGRQTT